MDLNVRGSGEELGAAEGGGTLIRMYCVRKESKGKITGKQQQQNIRVSPGSLYSYNSESFGQKSPVRLTYDSL